MKNLEKMTEDEKHGYIFEDTSFEGRPRSRWITDCLLGDIRTFLDGIENFIENEERPRKDGRGNLSVPILISTALEFVAALYAGKTNYILCFSDDIDKELKKEWEDFKIENLANRLRKMIKSKGFEIRKNASIGSFSRKIIVIGKYQIKKESGKLNVYENNNATDNVRKFIKDFFPEKYKDFPFLLWDGIRNGLVHSFYPKPFEDKGYYIRFQFVAEYRNTPLDVEIVDSTTSTQVSGKISTQTFSSTKEGNIPSSSEQSNKTVLIKINVFELYKILKNAIEGYLDKLRCDKTLQDKFIKAWSSIEDFTDKANDGQSKEIKELFDYLGSNSDALIWVSGGQKRG